MMYCPECMVLCENECPVCGSKKLREPEENDSVYIVTQNFIYGGIIEELFADNGIPCMKIGKRGAGVSITLGYVVEDYNFYVPFAAYEKAKALLAEAFPEGIKEEGAPDYTDIIGSDDDIDGCPDISSEDDADSDDDDGENR